MFTYTLQNQNVNYFMCNFVFQGRRLQKVCPVVLVPQLLCSAMSFLMSLVRHCLSSCWQFYLSLEMYQYMELAEESEVRLLSIALLENIYIFFSTCLPYPPFLHRWFCGLTEGGYVSTTGHLVQSALSHDGIFGHDHRHSDRSLCWKRCHVDLCSHGWVIHVCRSRGHGEWHRNR